MFTYIFLLIFAVNQVSAWEILHSKTDVPEGPCYPNDSCAVPRREEDDHLWNNYTCECGTHCILSRTCCADSPHINDVLSFRSGSETCEKLPSMFDTVIVDSKCFDQWRDSFIREKCEESPKVMEDPIAAAPVTSLRTYITYKNYFCALCNYDTRDVFMWNIALYFPDSDDRKKFSNVSNHYLWSNLTYDDDLKLWGIKDYDSFHEMKLQYSFPTSLLKVVKKCYQHVVSQCDPLKTYPYELQVKCLSYYAPVKLQLGRRATRFRNIDCASCNGVNITWSDKDMCKLDTVNERKRKPSLSFALLLDINQSDGNLVGKMNLCKENESWDPFFKKCRALVCALPGYVLKEGKCAPN